MKIKIKKLHPSATIPTYRKIGDAGMDLTAIDIKYDTHHITYKTGLAMSIPEGYVGFLFPRSSIYKRRQFLANSVGVIDSGYRGEIMLKLTRSSDELEYCEGDRVGQLIIMPYPKIEFNEVNQLSETDRSSGGFGSTGV
jgi:dUTP pyrophosphatase